MPGNFHSAKIGLPRPVLNVHKDIVMAFRLSDTNSKRRLLHRLARWIAPKERNSNHCFSYEFSQQNKPGKQNCWCSSWTESQAHTPGVNLEAKYGRVDGDKSIITWWPTLCLFTEFKKKQTIFKLKKYEFTFIHLSSEHVTRRRQGSWLHVINRTAFWRKESWWYS